MSQHVSRKRLSVLAAAVLTVAATGLAAGPADAAPRTVCSGGAIASGSYASLTVTGNCSIPDQATVTIFGDLTVAPGATLNAVSFGPGGLDLSNLNMATVHVHGNVFVRAGAILGLGCTPAMRFDPHLGDLSCSPTQNSDVEIGGNLIAAGARTMYLDGIKVDGNLVSLGGGPGLGVTQYDLAYNYVLKDLSVGRNLVVSGFRGGWIGSIRNQVRGNEIWAYDKGVDVDANEVITGTIGRNLICVGNSPAAQYGDAVFVPGAAPNTVGRHALGECAALTLPFPS
jgi:hypothetical protein